MSNSLWHDHRAKSIRFLGKRLEPSEVYGLSLTIGLVTLVAIGGIFADITEDVLDGGGFTFIDHPLLNFMANHRTPWLTDAMRAISDIASPVGLSVLAVVVIGWLSWQKRQVWPLGLAVLAIGGMEVIVSLIKVIIGRPRPPLAEAIYTAHGFAFPSGHTSIAVATCGIAAWLFARNVQAHSKRVMIWVSAISLAVLVSFSRLYLGVHWFSDVAGSWTLAICWLLVVLVPATTLFRKRSKAIKESGNG